MICYVSTNYGNRPEAKVESDINEYLLVSQA